MSSVFSIALSSLQAESEAINTTGNNLANMNTDGFKGSDVDFKDLFSQYIGNDSSFQTGLGVSVPVNNQLFTQGSAFRLPRLLWLRQSKEMASLL